MHHPTDRITHTTALVIRAEKHRLEQEIAHWVQHEVSIRRPIAPRLSPANGISLADSSLSLSLNLSQEEEGNVLFKDALNTFYLQLYGVRHMVKDHSDSVKGNPLPLHGLLFPISSKGSFICIIPHTG